MVLCIAFLTRANVMQFHCAVSIVGTPTGGRGVSRGSMRSHAGGTYKPNFPK